MAERPLPQEDGAEQEVKVEEEGGEDEGEEEIWDESEEEVVEERIVRRKIVIVVSFGRKGEEEEEEEEEGESVPPGACGPSEPPHAVDAGCQVDGCGADLQEAKRYHRRHKVCETHAKASVASVSGVDRRFCQQCSRFHELSQFDGAKRSCRNRLAGHNERRRKVPPDPKTHNRLGGDNERKEGTHLI